MKSQLLIESPSGIMVALYVPQEFAEKIAVEGGEKADDLHVTLAYIPKIGDDEEMFNKMCDALAPVAAAFQPVEGMVGGIGRFNQSKNSDGKDVYYASFDAPGLNQLVQMIYDALSAADFELGKDHGFTPHITLKYIDSKEPTPAEKKQTDKFKIPALSIASKKLTRKDLKFGEQATHDDIQEVNEWFDRSLCNPVTLSNIDF